MQKNNDYWDVYGKKPVSLAPETRRKIQERIKEGDRVLDVAGAKCIFSRADYIIDIVEYSEKTKNRAWGPPREYFTEKTWVVGDINEKMPFEDNFFDFVLCTHTLEDIRDPIGTCKEMMRIGKSGYLECPSRELESQMSLVKHGMIGFGNHRWFVDIQNGEVVFTNKAPYTYTDLGRRNLVLYDYENSFSALQNSYVGLFWENTFKVREKIIISTEEAISDQANFITKIKKRKYYNDWDLSCHKGRYLI